MKRSSCSLACVVLGVLLMFGLASVGRAQVRLLRSPTPTLDSLDLRRATQSPAVKQRLVPPIQRRTTALPLELLVIDTALEVSDKGTMRHLYAFNAAGKKTLDLIEAQLNGQWVNYSRTSYTYDERSNEMGWTFEGWSNGQWMNQFRRAISRDANGWIVSDLYQTWSEDQWVNSYRYTYAYDADGRTLSQMWENWMSARWVITWRELYTYDPGGNLLTDTYESYSNGQLAYQFRSSYSYDTNGRQLGRLIESWSGGLWANQSRERDSYDGNGRLDTILYESWSDNQWVNSGRVVHTYSQSDSLVTRVTEQWVDSTWITYERGSWAYDANRNLLWTLLELWADNQWVNFWRATHAYNALGNELSALTEFWRDEKWINNTRLLSGYDEQGNLTSASYDVWENSEWTPGNGMWTLVDSAGNEYRYEPASRIALHYRRLSTTAETNLVQNPGFESGRDHWQFYTSGAGSFSDNAIGAGSPHAGKVDIVASGENVQVYQSGIRLKAHTRYRLSFKAYSNSGHRLSVFIHKHAAPYTSYGLEDWSCALSTQWKIFMREFTTENIADSVNDARLRFWFAPFATGGDRYVIDDVELVETGAYLLTNGDFEWGDSGWEFYTNGKGSFDTQASADATNHVAHVTIISPGSNVQLYQAGVALDAGATYQLSFKAYSSAGHGLSIYVHKHGSPYQTYGFSWENLSLGTSWQTFTKDFMASGFTGTVNDGRLRFWLAPFATAGDEYFFDDVALTRIDGLGGIGVIAGADGRKEDIPKESALFQNYPNPFNPSTLIKYTVGGNRAWGIGVSDVSLVVYDVLGRTVATLVNEAKVPGNYEVALDGSNLPSGVYFYRLQAGTFSQTRKLLLLK